MVSVTVESYFEVTKCHAKPKQLEILETMIPRGSQVARRLGRKGGSATTKPRRQLPEEWAWRQEYGRRNDEISQRKTGAGGA
jgi:hypothetical protein